MEPMSLSEQESLENQPENQLENQLEISQTEKINEEPQDETNSEQDSSHQNPHRQHFDNFLVEIGKILDPDLKLQFAVDFMEASLAQGGTPHFKSFWEARNICLQLFKENISPPLRSILWIKYSDLSKEARRLKDILDEQSAYAVEQIEIAVKSLEDDILAFNNPENNTPRVQFNVDSLSLKSTLETYEQMQGQLNLLNTYAARINSMRKELIKTEMRVRQKNKFFQRLSAAGDNVFPKRKELIKEVSHSFITDVDNFITTYFSKEDFNNTLFMLREEIKNLQNMAKLLTLNTHSFTHTRMRLSECWDKIKAEDKERKKERVQQREAYSVNFDAAKLMLQEFETQYGLTNPSANEATKQLDLVVSQVRSLDLGRDELNTLRENVQRLRKVIQEKVHQYEAERLHNENEKERIRREKIQEVKSQIDSLLKTSASSDVQTVESTRDAIVETISSLNISKLEKQEIERQLKTLRDMISDMKESSLMALSDDDRQSLQQFKEVLKQRKERRQEIKTQMDIIRKSLGASGLGFEQAMNFNAQLNTEKERLEKINQGILEIEQKIAHLYTTEFKN